MGWTESPPAFSAATETIADIINEQLEFSSCIPPAHPLEHAASTHVPIVPSAHQLEHAASTHVPIVPSNADQFPLHESDPLHPPSLAYVDVYVDDFVKATQGWLNCY
jgi:hypothetical protein